MSHVDMEFVVHDWLVWSSKWYLMVPDRTGGIAWDCACRAGTCLRPQELGMKKHITYYITVLIRFQSRWHWPRKMPFRWGPY